MAKSIVSDLFNIFRCSVNAVLPEHLIRNSLKYNPVNQQLCILGNNYNIQNKNVYLVGTGKAVQNMAKEVENILNSKIKSGVISVPVGSLKYDISKNVMYYEGAKNNLPDNAAETTSKKIEHLITTLDFNDLLIVLISGGGSALLPLPKPPITLKEKTDLIKKLANSGADIKELNTVRKRLSDLKGGQLALKAQPANVVALILSDIVGDPLDLIASGPTVENEDDPSKSIDIINKYNLYETLPESIRTVLNKDNNAKEFPRNNVKNYIIGSNNICINAAVIECKNLNYFPITLSNKVTGDVKTVAKEYAKMASYFCSFLNGQFDLEILKKQIKSLDISGIDTDCLKYITKAEEIKNRDLCIILGGELTVKVKGKGRGGRNQQLALEFSFFLNMKTDIKNCDVYLLSAGTDGIDGPTNAAGAVGYTNLLEDSQKEDLDANVFIENNDCYNFYKHFRNGEFHLITGHTNTNVMDIHLLIIKKK